MEKLNAKKFIKGYSPLGFVKSFAVGSKIVIIVWIGWLVYVGMIKPHFNPIKTVTQTAKRDFTNVNIYREDTRFFGLKLGWLKLGIEIPKGEKKVKQIDNTNEDN